MNERVWPRCVAFIAVVAAASGFGYALGHQHGFDVGVRRLERRAQAGDQVAARERREYVLVAQQLFAQPGPRWSVHSPAWLVASLAAVLPAVWVYRMSRRRRYPPGQCARCGYDLRGIAGGRCPECGTETSEPAAEKPAAA
jgi:hypothetical protein